MSTYVIGDIHGEYEQLKILLEKMNFKEDDELFILGDVVDRGPNPIKALQFLMTLPNCTCIAGNHELMALTNLKLLLNEITDDFLDHLQWQILDGFRVGLVTVHQVRFQNLQNCHWKIEKMYWIILVILKHMPS